MMASVALSTVTASHQKSSPHHGSNPTYPRTESANTKQLMQLMDSLNRLGNENAQLMREVEEAKAARAEAVAAKNMMEQFKKEYNQRFLKVKEALEKYPRNASDNPVNNRYAQNLSLAIPLNVSVLFTALLSLLTQLLYEISIDDGTSKARPNNQKAGRGPQKGTRRNKEERCSASQVRRFLQRS